CMQSLDFPVTF
nr:immunoglobulin light chain junction region [Macaca mulatta]